MQQHCIDCQHYIALHTSRSSGKECIDGNDAKCADNYISINSKKLAHRTHLQHLRNLHLSELVSKENQQQNPRETHTTPLRHNCRICNARNTHIKTEDKPQTTQHVKYIDKDGCNHRNYSILHSRKPTIQAEEHNTRRHRPNTSIEVVGNHLISVHHPERKFAKRILQKQHHKTQNSRDTDSTNKHCCCSDKILCSKCLRGYSTRSHTDKRAVPVDEIKN